MIKARIFSDTTETWSEYFTLDGYDTLPTLDYRFDESLSEASFIAYTKDIPVTTPLEVWTKVELLADDQSFVGYVCDYHDITVVAGEELSGDKRATIGLIELLAVTQYIPMSGLCHTNEIDSTINSEGVVFVEISTRTVQQALNRISYQVYNVPFTEVTDIPFRFTLPSTAWWFNAVMPEMTFVESTLFDVFRLIGEAVGGFPYLTMISQGVYEINFRKWNDKNATQHTDIDFISVENYSTTQNQGYIVDSTVKNMLSVANNNDNAVTFPSLSALKGAVGDEYVASISEGDAYFEVDRDIQQILKVEISNMYMNDIVGVDTETAIDVTALFVEADVWKTLREGTFYEVYNPLNVATKNTRAYYTYGTKKISAEEGFWSSLAYYYSEKVFLSVGIDNYSYTMKVPEAWQIRVTYIPISEARVLARREGTTKPIGQFYNQENNIVSASSFASNVQGLANRIHGTYSVIQKLVTRGETLYNIGEWLNGKIIVSAQHKFTTTNVASTYTVTENFNRRNEYISLKHNQRQYEIPSGDTATDRNLLYSEEMHVSIGEALEESNGTLETRTMLDFVVTFGEQNKPCLAYIAWMTSTAISAETNGENSVNYALATVTAIPFGTAISFHWEAEDNASMGARSYLKNQTPILTNPIPILQQYVEYDPTATFLNWKLSNTIPTEYNFDPDITGTGEGLNVLVSVEREDIPLNKTFAYTFPMSNNEQYTGATSLATFQDFYISKDLSERILFNYMLNFVGKNNTIVYERATAICGLCNSSAFSGFKVWVSNGYIYSEYDRIPQGTSYTATITTQTVSNGNGVLGLSFGYTGAYSAIAITDSDDNLIYASNNASSGGAVTIYFSNRKMEWGKL